MGKRREWISLHAAQRMQKRAIPMAYVDMLLDFGRPHSSGDGCTSFSMDKEGWRKIESYFGPAATAMRKVRNAYVIIADDGTLVTAAWRG